MPDEEITLREFIYKTEHELHEFEQGFITGQLPEGVSQEGAYSMRVVMERGNFWYLKDVWRATRVKELKHLDRNITDYNEILHLADVVHDKQHWFKCGKIPRQDWEEWFLQSFRTSILEGYYGYTGKIVGKKIYHLYGNHNSHKRNITNFLLKYMILAVEHENLPEDFNFKKFLEIAARYAGKPLFID